MAYNIFIQPSDMYNKEGKEVNFKEIVKKLEEDIGNKLKEEQATTLTLSEENVLVQINKKKYNNPAIQFSVFEWENSNLPQYLHRLITKDGISLKLEYEFPE